MVPPAKKRNYDSTNRRRQAEQTRRRILDAALILFERDGYANATMTAIAEEANVAVQTVYASTTSKREILKGLADLAVSGCEEPVPVADSTQWRAIETDLDPRSKIAMFVRLHAEICARSASVFSVMAEAAGSDSEVRALMQHQAELRYQDQHRLGTLLADRRHLKTGMSADRAADIIWTLANERTYLALVRDRGWTIEEFTAWLTDQLQTALLR